MPPIRVPARLRGFPLPQFAWGAATLILLSGILPCSAQSPDVQKNEQAVSPPSAISTAAAPITSKQPASRKSSSEKAKADAQELSALANQLRDQLNKMNVNVLSLDIIQKTETIEKLARKIKGEAGGE